MIHSLCQTLSDKIDKVLGFDGLLHFSISAIMACILNILMGIVAAVTISLIIGIVKEIIDNRKGNWEIKDIICDCLGILIGVC